MQEWYEVYGAENASLDDSSYSILIPWGIGDNALQQGCKRNLKCGILKFFFL